MILVRHAWAGKRNEWKRDDRERPLDERGRAQARELVDELATFPIDRIVSSPYRRCVETVEPLARSRGFEVELRPELGEDRQELDGVALVRELIHSDAIVCGHGGLERAVPGAPRLKKGEVYVV
jgi:8-oxo-dGTP diphosphatase